MKAVPFRVASIAVAVTLLCASQLAFHGTSNLKYIDGGPILSVENSTNFIRNSTNGTRPLIVQSSISFIENSTTSTRPAPAVPLCSRDQIRIGKWIPKTLGRIPYKSKWGESEKVCGLYEGQQQRNITFQSHEWLPNDHHEKKCRFMPWARAAFCRALHNETILLIGDSLMQEHFLSLRGLLGLKEKIKPVDDQLVCNGTVRLVLRRADYLSSEPLQWELRDKFPKYAVLNRGAHYVLDGSLMTDINGTIEQIREWQGHCAEHNKKCQMIWRTTVPGHDGCSRFKGPVNNTTMMEELVAKGELANRFNWAKFKHQNEIVVNALKNASGITLDFIDAYDINLLRPDGHAMYKNDCLHSCLGSKVDVLSQVLLHFITGHHQYTKRGN